MNQGAVVTYTCGDGDKFYSKCEKDGSNMVWTPATIPECGPAPATAPPATAPPSGPSATGAASTEPPATTAGLGHTTKKPGNGKKPGKGKKPGGKKPGKKK